MNKLEQETKEFPKRKENYCPRCYFEDALVVLRDNCPHNLLNKTTTGESWRRGYQAGFSAGKQQQKAEIVEMIKKYIQDDPTYAEYNQAILDILKKLE